MALDEPHEPEFNVSRLWRDTASNSVWEGTTNVLASETIRHLTNGKNLAAFDTWMADCIGHISQNVFRSTLEIAWKGLASKLASGQHEQGLVGVLAVARQIMFTLAWLISGILLALDAQRDSDAVASEVARRWILEGQGIPGEFGFPDLVYRHCVTSSEGMSQRERTGWDCRIVWGVELPLEASTGYRIAKI